MTVTPIGSRYINEKFTRDEKPSLFKRLCKMIAELFSNSKSSQETTLSSPIKTLETRLVSKMNVLNELKNALKDNKPAEMDRILKALPADRISLKDWGYIISEAHYRYPDTPEHPIITTLTTYFYQSKERKNLLPGILYHALDRATEFTGLHFSNLTITLLNEYSSLLSGISSANLAKIKRKVQFHNPYYREIILAALFNHAPYLKN